MEQETQSHNEHTGGAHIHPIGMYVNTFLVLLALLGLTVWVAFQDFGAFNTLVAMAVAVLKAMLVVMFFMGLRDTSKLTKIWAFMGVFFLLVMFGLSLGDYFTRWMHSIGW